MKNFLRLFVFVLGFCLISACDKNQEEQNADLVKTISADHVYFFYQTSCPHCHYAADYITKKYPDLKMINLDVRMQSNYNLFLKCASKFKLNPNTLGTPLICMGDHYIMGWSDTDKVKFDLYVQKFK